MFLIAQLYIVFIFALIFVFPIHNYCNLRLIQHSKNNVKGYFCLKTLLVVQPSIVTIALFFLNIFVWTIVWCIFPYFPRKANICIYILIGALGTLGLYFFLKFIKNTIKKFFIRKLSSQNAVNMLIKMTEEGISDVSALVYFSYIILVPALIVMGNSMQEPD